MRDRTPLQWLVIWLAAGIFTFLMFTQGRWEGRLLALVFDGLSLFRLLHRTSPRLVSLIRSIELRHYQEMVSRESMRLL